LDSTISLSLSKDRSIQEEMRLQFWYSKGVKQWHWTLHTRHYAPKGKDYYHTSGSGNDVREVMDKVATEVEQLVEERNNETNTETH